MSRFLQQLLFESKWTIGRHILNNPIQLKELSPIVVAKTPEVMEALSKLTDVKGRGVSPSALNDYIECGLRFYLRHIAGMREADEVEEDLDARVFGNFLHEVMDGFYKELIERKQHPTIEKADLLWEQVDPLLVSLIDRSFKKHYHEEIIEYRGQRVVVREIVKQFAHRIIELDRYHAPFTIELLEEKNFNAPFKVTVNGTEHVILIGGRIDRVDSKDNQVRVIDYKTGKDEAGFESIYSLFARKGKRNKAAFQTILYAWLYEKVKQDQRAVIPMLMNRVELFGKDGLMAFEMNRQPLLDVRPYLKDFESRLGQLLTELYNPVIAFTQTEEEANCKYCLFKQMCRR
jgi:CRISPR/Cas system-associated exonuclease Cas4 (RecB family)